MNEKKDLVEKISKIGTMGAYVELKGNVTIEELLKNMNEIEEKVLEHMDKKEY